MKVICPSGVERVSILAYLVLGWMILVGARPMLGSVDARTAVLIGVGGVIYSIGTGFHHWRTLPFHNAISHSLVFEKPLCDLGRRGIGRNRHHVLCHDILCLHVRTYFRTLAIRSCRGLLSVHHSSLPDTGSRAMTTGFFRRSNMLLEFRKDRQTRSRSGRPRFAPPKPLQPLSRLGPCAKSILEWMA